MAKQMTKYYTKIQLFGLILGVFLFSICQIIPFIPSNLGANNLASIAMLMVVWWITEAVPLGVTSLIPIILFPITGLLSGEEVAGEFINSTIFLFLGGFLIAIAMEKWNLHKRISLKIIKMIGSGPARIIGGFMIASGFISMFISNTATALMMLPIAMAVVKSIESTVSEDKLKRFSIPLMLGIAYACSVGGIATLIGTAPNLVFLRLFKIHFPLAPEISFSSWFFCAFPIAVVMLLFIWLLLTKILYRSDKTSFIDNSIIDEEYQQLGKMTFEEKSVLYVFISAILMWMFRTDIEFGSFTIPGWASLLSLKGLIDDGTVGITMASILFLIPSKRSGERILNAESFNKIPWEIVILFGGGFALAKGFQVSGLSEIIGNLFLSSQGVHPLFMIVSVCFVITFLTELTSNTATTQTVLPIIATVSVSLNINPLFLMIPATISASFAFMLPVATPPNAIVFGPGKMQIKDMARAGLIINLVGVVVVSAIFYFIGNVLFNIDLSQLPDWAK